MKKPTRAQLAGGMVLLLVLAVPLPYTIVPAWAPRIVDISGAPQAGIRAVETWRHPLLQSEARHEAQISDAQGRVAFSERTAWSNGLIYLYRAAGTFAAAGLAASFAPDASVWAAKAGFNGGDFYLSGRDPAATVIIHRDGVCPADEVFVKAPAPAPAPRP